MQIDTASTVVRKAEIVFSEIDEETVLLDSMMVNYFGTEAVGSRVWQLLEHETTVDDLLNALTSEFDVSKEQCATDTLPFLASLLEQGMLTVRETEPSA